MSIATSEAEALLQELRDLGVELSVDSGMLRFNAPRDVLKPPLMNRMRKHKPALIELLQQESSNEPAAQTIVPVTQAQEALWLIDRQFPGSHAYNAAGTLRLVSAVDAEALERAFRKLVARHEPLRTTFRSSARGVEAIIHDSNMLDFRRECAADVIDDDELLRRVRAAYQEPFELAEGPLTRVRLISRSNTNHVLLIVVHHIVFDAWSLWVALNELKQLYASEVSGSDCLLPRLPARFADFVSWQRELPGSEIGRKQWSFWESQLSGDPVPAELPWDFARPRHSAPAGTTLHFPVNQSLASGLRDLGRKAGATPLATGLAVFQSLVYRLNPQEDSIVGITTSGRSKKEFADAIGYFVNTLPLRSQLSGDQTFLDVLDQTKRTLVDAIANQDFPFAEMVHRIAPVRELGAAPLCRVVFGLQKPMAGQDVSLLLSGEDRTVEFGPAEAAPFKMDQQEGQFDLVMELYETPSGYSGVLKYDGNLLSGPSARRFADRFVQLLGQVIKDPKKPIREYEVLLEQEREQLRCWSNWDDDSSQETQELYSNSVKECFEAQVDIAPDAIATVFDDVTLTYKQLDDRANQMAHLLRRSGAQPSDRILIASNRRIDVPILLLACAKLGACYVPVSPQLPGNRLQHVLSEFQPRVFIGESSILDEIDSDDAGLALLRVDELAESAGSEPTSRMETSVPSSATAYIICTSGSTGTPKGIAVSNDALCQHLVSIQKIFGTRSSDRMYQFSDFTFDPSIEQMLVPWSVGAAVVFRGEELPSASAFWRCMREQRVTIGNLPPKYLEECTRSMPVGEHWPSELRLMISGGDVFPSEVVRPWREQGVRLVNAYGPTETVITATTYEIDGCPGGNRLPIGKPKPGATALVVNAFDSDGFRAMRDLPLAPIGTAGELCIRGAMLAEGYVNQPEQTATQFVSLGDDGSENRIYRTGDLARWNHDGQLEFLGRIDRQVKVRGFRIELGDIEAAIASYDGVIGAAVKVVPHGSDAFVAGFYTVAPSSDVSETQLIGYLKQRLPSYMLPSQLIKLDEIPLLPSGKIDSNALHAEAPQSVAIQRDYVAPRNELEETVADVWASVLSLERVGINDDFYELGGGSLQSLRIVALLEERGVHPADKSGGIQPQMLFQFTTISELSSYLQLSGK